MAATREQPASAQGATVVALAGRRVDIEGASVSRFPLANRDAVGERLFELFKELGAQTLVCSAACGADLLALEAAERLDMRTRILLPFDREQFKATSVTDRPGDWADLYDRMCDRAEAQGSLIVVASPEGEPQDYASMPIEFLDALYAKMTCSLLDDARTLSCQLKSGRKAKREGIVTAVVVWDGVSRGPDDLTACFVDLAHARKLAVAEVRTY